MKYKWYDYWNVRPIKGYLCRYWVSKAGRVYDICMQRRLSEHIHEWGYISVKIEVPRIRPLIGLKYIHKTPGNIRVSSKGRLCCYGEPYRFLEPIPAHPSEYLAVQYDYCFIHQYVAEAFIVNPRPHQYTTVNHKDCIRKNFHYSNLEWVTPSENNKHARVMGRGRGLTCKVKDGTALYRSYSIETGAKVYHDWDDIR